MIGFHAGTRLIGETMLWLSLGTSLSFAQVGDATSVKLPYAPAVSELVISVGVRAQAEPFAYRKASRRGFDIIEGYGGYMVEVCRTVLRQMVGAGYFKNHSVRAVKITAEDRFAKLAAREIDLLCGPDSITTDRLQNYNISHPIFLSGVALVSHPDHKIPQKNYCGPLVGMVGGTTAQLAGLQAVFDAKLFRRFSEPVGIYLALQRDQPEHALGESLAARLRKLIQEIKPDANEQVFAHDGRNAESPSLIKTVECPEGFKEGPVITYEEHDAGLADLCRGRTLFYIGDVDIVKRKLPKTDCDVTISRRTFTREAYGIYFRRVPSLAKAEVNEAERIDAVLYSEFNNTLFSQMQNSENVLADQYTSEFGDAEMADDLASFFRSFQYATNY